MEIQKTPNSQSNPEKGKGIQIRKEKVKLSLFAVDMILYIKILKLPENYQNSMNLVKLQVTKLINRNLLHFYTLTMKGHKNKFKKQFQLPLHQK